MKPVRLANDVQQPAVLKKKNDERDWHSLEKQFFQRVKQCVSQPIYLNANSHEGSDQIVEATPFDVQGHLKLNVGGSPFRITLDTVTKRHSKCLLYKFAFSDHETRLQLCNGYLEETEEYFFERSPTLFEAVYLYYITGECHKPLTPCLEVFANDLAFWGLTDVFFANCCWAEAKRTLIPDGANETTTGTDNFKHVCMGQVRAKVWQLIEVPESSFAARVFSLASIMAVLVSNVGLILGSIDYFQVRVPQYSSNGTIDPELMVYEPHPVLEYVEYGCIALFSLEYAAKMLVACDRRRVFLQPMNLIDLVAIVPFYVELGLGLLGLDTASLQDVKGALLVMRILRVLRVIRLLKLGRYSTGLQIFAKTMHRSSAQLGMLLVVLAIGIMFFATMLYFIEKDEVDTKFSSIPAGFWWCIVTMTTVGYGDMYPTTIIGKLVASCCIACGVLVLALPITVMVENFMRIQEELNVKPVPQRPTGAEANHNEPDAVAVD